MLSVVLKNNGLSEFELKRKRECNTLPSETATLKKSKRTMDLTCLDDMRSISIGSMSADDFEECSPFHDSLFDQTCHRASSRDDRSILFDLNAMCIGKDFHHRCKTDSKVENEKK